jgi:protein subunit release factor A
MTDHRVDLTLYSLDRIMEGILDPVLMPLREKDLSERVASGLGSIGGA